MSKYSKPDFLVCKFYICLKTDFLMKENLNTKTLICILKGLTPFYHLRLLSHYFVAYVATNVEPTLNFRVIVTERLMAHLFPDVCDFRLQSRLRITMEQRKLFTYLTVLVTQNLQILDSHEK